MYLPSRGSCPRRCQGVCTYGPPCQRCTTYNSLLVGQRALCHDAPVVPCRGVSTKGRAGRDLLQAPPPSCPSPKRPLWSAGALIPRTTNSSIRSSQGGRAGGETP
ncbi:hypothetical protein MTO96_022215 [Rhipicephalus appendiculatus]